MTTHDEDDTLSSVISGVRKLLDNEVVGLFLGILTDNEDAFGVKRAGTQAANPEKTRDPRKAERFYVHHMEGWEQAANRHMSDPDVAGVLSCALITLIDAYKYAASWDDD
jgi:hypothetical protein